MAADEAPGTAASQGEGGGSDGPTKRRRRRRRRKPKPSTAGAGSNGQPKADAGRRTDPKATTATPPKIGAAGNKGRRGGGKRGGKKRGGKKRGGKKRGGKKRTAKAAPSKAAARGTAKRGAQRPKIPTTREVSAGGVVYRRADDGIEIVLASRRTRRGQLAWGLAKGG